MPRYSTETQARTQRRVVVLVSLVGSLKSFIRDPAGPARGKQMDFMIL